MTTTARASVRAGMVVCATAFATANPTLCRSVLAVRPTRLSGDIPFCFIDILTEDGLHTAGTQQRVLEPSFVFVIRPIENSEQVTQADAIVDGFTEFLKDYAAIATNTVWSRYRMTEESIEGPDGTVYPSLRFTLLDVTEMTGRTA
jgi:hypothetical protein